MISIGQLFHDLVFDYTLRTVALGSAALGLVSGALGCFAVLRRQSLLGDAVSHAALPGIVLAFLLTGSKAPLVLVVGAALTGWAASLLVMLIVRTTRIPRACPQAAGSVPSSPQPARSCVCPDTSSNPMSWT